MRKFCLEECPECLQEKKACFAYEDEKCKALIDTNFKYDCPFYKTKEQRERELKNETC